MESVLSCGEQSINLYCGEQSINFYSLYKTVPCQLYIKYCAGEMLGLSGFIFF